MVNSVVLYAAKSEEEYLKLEPDGIKLVSMQKASVYTSVSALREALEPLEALHASPDGRSIGDYRVVELTITERELE